MDLQALRCCTLTDVCRCTGEDDTRRGTHRAGRRPANPGDRIIVSRSNGCNPSMDLQALRCCTLADGSHCAALKLRFASNDDTLRCYYRYEHRYLRSHLKHGCRHPTTLTIAEAHHVPVGTLPFQYHFRIRRQHSNDLKRCSRPTADIRFYPNPTA